MRSSAKLLPGLVLALSSSFVAAQSNLGELLDAGAARLSAAEFREQIVQRTIVGPTPSGSDLEIMYIQNGSIQGLGKGGTTPQLLLFNAPIAGDWTIDESERICTALRITPSTGFVTILPARCQFWFKLGDAYFLSDLDSDRRAKVLRRTLKP